MPLQEASESVGTPQHWGSPWGNRSTARKRSTSRDAQQKIVLDLDRIEWLGRFAFECLGVRIAVRSSDLEWLDAMRDLLPPGSKSASASDPQVEYSLVKERDTYVFYRGEAHRRQSTKFSRICRSLELDFHKGVGRNAEGRLFVHAGAVGWNGGGIVIPSRSRRGKTSLVEAMIRRGATYFTDDWAVFDAEGRLHPYAKPLMVRHPETGTTNKSVEDIGGTIAKDPTPVQLVVLTKYLEGAAWKPRENSQAQAMMALFERAILARDKPEFALSVLQRVVERASVLKVTRGEADEAAEAILAFAETKIENQDEAGSPGTS